ncbi:MAG: pyruvate formate lyase family protein [Clostridiaceae bacterium]|nr:pyruvate formate lyase family protein [Clostridiaceae bacterium]
MDARFDRLKAAVMEKRASPARPADDYYAYLAFRTHLNDPVSVAKGYVAAARMRDPEAFVYDDDLIAGSARGRIRDDLSDAQYTQAHAYADSFGRNTFRTNADHFAPDYNTFLERGVAGTLSAIDRSLAVHRIDADFPKKRAFLTGARAAMEGFRDMLLKYAAVCEKKAASGDDERRSRMLEIASDLRYLSAHPPVTFRQALQLVWMTHTAFYYESRYAMAFGRMDQFLYPYYQHDIDAGTLTFDGAVTLLRATLIKLGESFLFGGDNVCNIAIAGCTREGKPALNELSYALLYAVRDCNIPGPNLSARLYDGIDPHFIDECLKVIGTGLGYPALMNDDVNIPALARHGYTLEDARDYCMVGCIENFIPGKQPPWSDGRWNTPLYIEAVLTRGKSMLDGRDIGIDTGKLSSLDTMDKFMAALEAQLQFSADEYVRLFDNENDRYNRSHYVQPFLSCFCEDCIGRGLDVNDGGALYPSVHGAGCMGIATVADSLAAIEKTVYVDRIVTLEALRDALAADFEGNDDLRRALLACPKYGNDDDFVDKYAVWFVEIADRVFSTHRTHDGGAYYTAIASNVSNIPAGLEVAAMPDGRRAREPLSDAASPMHGMDTSGPTAVIKSCTKPDYTLVSCGTVLNQKYSPVMFRDPALRAKLLSLIQTYLRLGGQEMQINAVSREVLRDAMAHPENYAGLVVRVSGFSMFYTRLSRAVQEDILMRTEHE